MLGKFSAGLLRRVLTTLLVWRLYQEIQTLKSRFEVSNSRAGVVPFEIFVILFQVRYCGYPSFVAPPGRLFIEEAKITLVFGPLHWPLKQWTTSVIRNIPFVTSSAQAAFPAIPVPVGKVAMFCNVKLQPWHVPGQMLQIGAVKLLPIASSCGNRGSAFIPALFIQEVRPSYQQHYRHPELQVLGFSVILS